MQEDLNEQNLKLGKGYQDYIRGASSSNACRETPRVNRFIEAESVQLSKM